MIEQRETRQEKERRELVERIGDGSQFRPEHYDALTTAEKNQLFRVNPERYRAIRDNKPLAGEAWTPERGR